MFRDFRDFCDFSWFSWFSWWENQFFDFTFFTPFSWSGAVFSWPFHAFSRALFVHGFRDFRVSWFSWILCFHGLCMKWSIFFHESRKPFVFFSRAFFGATEWSTPRICLPNWNSRIGVWIKPHIHRKHSIASIYWPSCKLSSSSKLSWATHGFLGKLVKNTNCEGPIDTIEFLGSG